MERFWSKVDKNGPLFEGEPCWLWTAATSSGYGRLGSEYAHRVAYELLVGPIPEGTEIDHLCRNPPCVNPAHLEPVPHRINLLRGVGASAKHAAKTHCPQGHPYDGMDAQGARRCSICRKEQSDRANGDRPTTRAEREAKAAMSTRRKRRVRTKA